MKRGRGQEEDETHGHTDYLTQPHCNFDNEWSCPMNRLVGTSAAGGSSGDAAGNPTTTIPSADPDPGTHPPGDVSRFRTSGSLLQRMQSLREVEAQLKVKLAEVRMAELGRATMEQVSDELKARYTGVAVVALRNLDDAAKRAHSVGTVTEKLKLADAALAALERMDEEDAAKRAPVNGPCP